MSRQSTETLIHAFISSRLDYCNSLLYGSLSYQLKKLPPVQNTIVGVIFQEAKYSHVMSLLRELHWLLVKILITFKLIHGQAPYNLSELITIKQKSRNCLGFASSVTLNYCPIKLLATLGDRSFSVAALRLWNALLESIRNTNDIH